MIAICLPYIAAVLKDLLVFSELMDYVKFAMQDFDMDDSKWNHKNYICDYFKECIQDDEKYATFMKQLRSYKKYSGFENVHLNEFFNSLTEFSKYSTSTKVQDDLLISFKWVFQHIGYMLRNNFIARDFKGDFFK